MAAIKYAVLIPTNLSLSKPDVTLGLGYLVFARSVASEERPQSFQIKIFTGKERVLSESQDGSTKQRGRGRADRERGRGRGRGRERQTEK